jgi:hypothetical protein
MSSKDLFSRKRHLAVHFGKPVYAKEILLGLAGESASISSDGTPYKLASQKVMELIAENIKK